MVSAQKFDKDRLYTKIDQHRFWQNTKTWGPFLLPVPYKSWATFYAVNLFLMMHRQMNWNCNQAMIITKLIINLGGDSGGGGGGAELANRGMSPWTGYCQCFSHLAHDLVQVLFILLHHILWLVDVDVALLIFLGSCWTVLPHVISPDLGWAQTPAASFTLHTGWVLEECGHNGHRTILCHCAGKALKRG